jgi:type IV pilus assembly protein PilE
MPANLKQSPADATAPTYTLTINASVTSYTLTMAPISSGSMGSDECGSFILTSSGARTISTTTDTTTRDKCWR